MTPSPRGEQALRAITVQSLADLGYGVDVTHADAYFLRGAVSAKVSAKDVVKPETSCADSEVQEPIFVVDELGNIIHTLRDLEYLENGTRCMFECRRSTDSRPIETILSSNDI